MPKADAVPPLSERRKPGLSATLSHERHPERCQSCGIPETRSNWLQHWIECDEWDKPTDVVVLLCEHCASRQINRHPRMYILEERNKPRPGTMALCVQCIHRRGLGCTNPQAKLNGGPGVTITCRKPDTMFVCGHKSVSGVHHLYGTPASACSGREIMVLGAPPSLEAPAGNVEVQGNLL